MYPANEIHKYRFLPSQRHALNAAVAKAGNSLWHSETFSKAESPLEEKVGLGSLLAANINCGNVAATTGAIVPYAILTGFGELVSPELPLWTNMVFGAITYACLFPFTVSASVAGAVVGKSIGARHDRRINTVLNDIFGQNTIVPAAGTPRGPRGA